MQILQIASGDFFSTYGGGQVYVKNIVDEMIRQQYAVQVISFVNRDCAIEGKKYKGINLYEVGTHGIEQLQLLLEQIRPDIIHVHSHKAQLVELGKTLQIPVIVTAHHGGIVCPAGTLLDSHDRICSTTVSYKHCLACCLRNIRSGRYWYPFMRWLPQQSYKRLGVVLEKIPFIPFITPIGKTALSIERKQAEWEKIVDGCIRMVAPSKAIAEAMQQNDLNEEKVTILPHGIPLPMSSPNFPPVIDGKIKFFYIGRICYVKGLHILLKAFSLLDNPRIELHLIGGSGNKGERRYERRLKKRYASDTRIVWHGKIPAEQVFEVIKPFHISVSVPIYLEVFGLNMAESLAMGKPVLATRCGGAEMQIEEDVNGWLVDPNDVEALARKMEDLSNHFTSYDSTLSTQRVISIESHCNSLIKLYEAVTH
ncbi:glycosyltransferase family 4 protein [Barnesiella viscericola]|uniref:glycosyltransferase family 4 protein n=1 Tax=Barnesiella viscericola TaxID=397865 RepID=UPI00255C1C9B|nr:glycosyltransferase family 4 protein [Barnesiella viscericola]